MAEKSEKATPKKLRDARKKGQVAKSQDFPSAFTFIVSISVILSSAPVIYEKLASYMLFIFRSISSDVDLDRRAGGFLSHAAMTILDVSFPLLLFTVIAGVLVNFLIVGPLFAVEAMKPDIKRLNPVDNLKNLFKFKTLFELLKSIAKISGAVILIYTVVMNSVPEIVQTAALPVMGSLFVFSTFLKKVVMRVGIFFITVAVLDLVFQKRNFANEMKMEKFQVKQEYKDTEGDPQIKSKRKQRAQEIAYQDSPNAAKNARAVITNPTHIAVAIHYEDKVEENSEEEPDPPIILAMGQDRVAQEIIRIAEENNIPIMRNVPLAHLLLARGEPGDVIPDDPEIYLAIAEILQYLAKLEEGSKEVNAELFT